MSTIPPYPVAPQPAQRDSALAIVSLITGIASWVFLPIVGALTAIITGHLAISEINKSSGMLKGKGMATAGLILGYIQIAVFLIVIVVLTLLAPTIGSVFSNVQSSMY
jgi:hypothetical protein